MKIITVASQKGGSGKTTLAGHLAVQAEMAGVGPVVLIDADPQGSLSDWWNERSAPTPAFAQTSVDRMAFDLARLREEGFAYAIIDTPPAIVSAIQAIVALSDLVVIPTRPSPHDLRAAAATVSICEKLDKRLMFVVNAASPRARLTAQAAIALSQHGTVAPTIVHNRVDFAASMIDGRTVMELNAKSKSTGEVIALWDYVRSRADNIVNKLVLTPPKENYVEPVEDDDDDMLEPEVAAMVQDLTAVAPHHADVRVEPVVGVARPVAGNDDDDDPVKRAQMQAARAQEARMQKTQEQVGSERPFRAATGATRTIVNIMGRPRTFGHGSVGGNKQ